MQARATRRMRVYSILPYDDVMSFPDNCRTRGSLNIRTVEADEKNTIPVRCFTVSEGVFFA